MCGREKPLRGVSFLLYSTNIYIYIFLLALSSQPDVSPDFVTPVSASQPVPLTPGLIDHASTVVRLDNRWQGLGQWVPILKRTCQKKSAVGFMRTSMLLYRRSDARKLPGERKNDPTTRETSPGGEPFSHPSIPRMIKHKHSSINGRLAHCQAVTWITPTLCGRP